MTMEILGSARLQSLGKNIFLPDCHEDHMDRMLGVTLVPLELRYASLTARVSTTAPTRDA